MLPRVYNLPERAFNLVEWPLPHAHGVAINYHIGGNTDASELLQYCLPVNMDKSYHVCNESLQYMRDRYLDVCAELCALKLSFNATKDTQQGSKSRADQATLLRRELVSVYSENAELRNIIAQKDAKIEEITRDLQGQEIRHAQDVTVQQLQIKRLEDEIKRLELRLGAHENRNKPGDNPYNKAREKLREEESIRSGSIAVDNHCIGPPKGHGGHHVHIGIARTMHHETKRCPVCQSEDLTPLKLISKCIRDFCGDTRYMECIQHQGHMMSCKCGHNVMPQFPSIQGTSFGPELLRHILVYCTRRATDSDISYYFKILNKENISDNSIWNARQAISHVLGPSMQYIMQELRKAEFLQLDESVYKYGKRKIYVWIIRSHTATLILPLLGRGADDIRPYVKDLLDKPIVVDGYVVYPNLFNVIQRCWAHILREAEDVCIKHKDNPHYRDLYHGLQNIFRRAKRIAKNTAPHGGADTKTCNALADEVRVLAAGYGDLKFAVTLTNAADNLFTFLRYPCMPPTNNNSELELRDWVVLQRTIRRKFMSTMGMAVFGILQSFAATCTKLGLNVGDSFIKILEMPLYSIFEDAPLIRTGGLSKNSGLTPALPAPPILPALPAAPTVPALPVLPAPSAPPIPPTLPAAPTVPVLPVLPAVSLVPPIRPQSTPTMDMPAKVPPNTFLFYTTSYCNPLPKMQMQSTSCVYLPFRGKPPPSA